MKEPGEVFTPRDYAEWLVDKFRPYTKIVVAEAEYIEDSKKCALMAVDSAIDSTRMLVSHYVKSNGVKAYMDIQLSKDLTLTYWREVKKEIEKL